MSLTPFGYRNSGFLFDDLQRDMDALWALVPGDKQSQRAVGGWSPKVDVKVRRRGGAARARRIFNFVFNLLCSATGAQESETQITVHADLPGVKKDDLHVELHDGVLTVSGKREATKSEKNDKYHYVERNFGSVRKERGARRATRVCLVCSVLCLVGLSVLSVGLCACLFLRASESTLRVAQFSRSFRVPDNVTEEHIAADLSDGVLNVTVTKPKPVETVKKIKIGVNGK